MRKRELMKRAAAGALAATLIIGGAAAGGMQVNAATDHGFSIVCTNAATEAAADEELKAARAAYDKAMEGLTGVDYVQKLYIGSQVVAGTNYYFLCKATVVYPGSKPYWTIVSVYEDLEGNCTINDIEKFQKKDYTKDKSADEDLTGAVSVYTDSKKIALKGKAKTLYNKYFKNIQGMSYKPVAYLGKSGSKYYVLCLGTSVTKASSTHLYMLTLKSGTSKTPTICAIY